MTDLVDAAYKGDLKSVKKLCTKETIDQTDEKKYTPLMWAAFRDQTKVVTYLLEQKANINAQNVYGRTALMLAAQNDSFDTLRILTQSGADLSIKDRWVENVFDFGNRTKVSIVVNNERGKALIKEFFVELEFVSVESSDSGSPSSSSSSSSTSSSTTELAPESTSASVVVSPPKERLTFPSSVVELVIGYFAEPDQMLRVTAHAPLPPPPPPATPPPPPYEQDSDAEGPISPFPGMNDFAAPLD